MSVAELLKDLRSKGIEVALDDERLLCRAPKGALTDDVARSLRDRKPEIVEFLRQGKDASQATSGAPEIVRVPRQHLMPASSSQQRLWYLHAVEENPAVYNLPLCFELKGQLDVDILGQVVTELIERHESLRTTIEADVGEPALIIHQKLDVPLRMIDLNDVPEAERAGELSEVLELEAMRPFDLSVPPLIRTLLVRSGECLHHLLITMHHINADGLSQQILHRELLALYEAHLGGGPFPLDALPIQFADFAAWQRTWLDGPALERQLQYWLDRLGADLPVFEMATDFQRPAMRTAKGRKEAFRASIELVAGLKALAFEEAATLYMVTLAAFGALLHRYSWHASLMVGTPVANRSRRELEGVVGFIINTVLVRMDFSAGKTFRELLREVRRDCIGALHHQDLPFQKLIEALEPERDLSRSPLFQVFFAYQDVPDRVDRIGDVEVRRVFVGSSVARTDFSLWVRELAEEMNFSLEYNTDLYERASILGMLEHFELLLRQLVEMPDAAIAQLPFQTDRDKDLLRQLNDTHREYHTPETIHGLIEAQVETTPDAVACDDGSATLTYAELNARADKLASHLRSYGVTTGTVVGICVDRSVDMLVGLLGILKAGAAYLPLDPDFPQSRLAFLMEDASVAFVVTQHRFSAMLRGRDLTLICLDSDWESAARETAGNHPTFTGRDDLAYLIYTSGSTGKPKGVEIEHRQALNFLAAMREEPGCSSDDTLVAVTTLSFDIALLELFLPLTVGAKVVLASRELAMDPWRLSQLLRDSGATIMQATPATWRMLIEAKWDGKADLKILCGGEALSPDLALHLGTRGKEVWNMYGPTETTVWSTCMKIGKGGSPVLIGKPIGNTEIRVVDSFGHAAPVGVPGELFIGGAGVARGYRDREDLTRARFGPDPLGEVQGLRFYRTGDQVKLRADGNLVYLGRLDSQVKVQGFRIELGEIEAALRDKPEVREAVVVTKNDGTGTRLVAYVVYQEGEELTSSEVRESLREYLPQYMVPGLIVELDSIPLTPNGKVDRKALPDPMRRSDSPVPEHTAPESQAERLVAEIWREHLDVHGVAREDNFFELGGHSLLSLRVVAAVEARTGYRLDPRKMFFQSLAQIACDLESVCGVVPKRPAMRNSAFAVRKPL